MKISYEPIGIIHTPFENKIDAPIQGFYSPESKGKVEIFPQYSAGLKDISGFSHLILIYHFHLAKDYSLATRPFLDNEERGIFSIRHFNRPNPIGLSIVHLDNVKGNVLEISEIDIIDGTPLLDIKPYVPDFDIKQNVSTGWYQNASNRKLYKQRKGVRPHPNAE